MTTLDGSEGKRYATSYALKADELYYGFPTKKHIRLKSNELPARFDGKYRELYGEILRYFFYLLIKDIIENQVIFKLPQGAQRTWIQMDPISGEDFIKARQNGAFEDVDYINSNFTGYQLFLRYNTRYGHWKKRIYLSKKFKDKITELTNRGVGW